MLTRKLLIAGLLAILLPLSVFAQETFTFEADHTTINFTEAGFYQFHGTLTNTSSSEDTFVITRVSVEAPEGWTSSICTHEACYPPFLDEVEDPLTPGQVDDTWSLDLQTSNEVAEGDQAVIILRFASSNVPTDTLRETFTLTYGTSSAGETAAQPMEYALHPVYPNPFNAMSKVSFTLPQTSKVKLMVMSVDGRVVQTLADGILPAGNHQRVFASTSQMASGTYLVTLQAGDQSFVQRAVLLK